MSVRIHEAWQVCLSKSGSHWQCCLAWFLGQMEIFKEIRFWAPDWLVQHLAWFVQLCFTFDFSASNASSIADISGYSMHGQIAAFSLWRAMNIVSHSNSLKQVVHPSKASCSRSSLLRTRFTYAPRTLTIVLDRHEYTLPSSPSCWASHH